MPVSKFSWKTDFLYCVSLVVLLVSSPVSAQASDDISDILTLPEEEIDLGIARLIIEERLYSNIDVDKSLREIDRIISIIKSMPEFGDSSLEKMGTVLRYLYTPGPWNDFKSYKYDLSDPFGTKNPLSKSISYYIATKTGNCVSMPILVTILGDRLDVNVHLSIAPLHVFARFTDDQGDVTNIETTSGTLLSDEEYVKAFDIHPDAIKHGIYLQDLSRKEAIAFMLYDIGRQYLHSGRYDEVLKLSDLMLKYHPKLVNAMLLKGNVYSMKLSDELTSLRQNGKPITLGVRQRLDPLYEKNLFWFSKAESLGWREPSADFDKRYLQQIEKFIRP